MFLNTHKKDGWHMGYFFLQKSQCEKFHTETSERSFIAVKFAPFSYKNVLFVVLKFNAVSFTTPKIRKCRNLQGHATILSMKNGQKMKGERLSIFERVVWSRLQQLLSSMSRRKRVKIYRTA